MHETQSRFFIFLKARRFRMKTADLATLQMRQEDDALKHYISKMPNSLQGFMGWDPV
jgi:hypothetical protein